MNEEKTINEQELENVSGGLGGAGFDQAWAAYESSHCGVCGRGEKFAQDVSGGMSPVCESGMLAAAAAWEAGQPVWCPGFIDPC